MGVLKELQRRNVFRVAVGYIVSSWLLLQVADLVLENIAAPDWVIQTIMLVLALGFPVVVFFSWAYEVTPEGIKRESEVDRSESVTHVTGQKIDRAITIALILAVGYFAIDKYVLPSQKTSDTSDAAANVENQAPFTEPVAPDTDRSIAVLPFVNMSGDPNNEYFSDGLSETLLHMLAQVPELKVSARTSSFAFKNHDQDIRSIAISLGVAHILEGSVQRAGGRVRITAQLIRAEDGFHVWSENYDRTLEDVFGIQDEIAQLVSTSLTTSLLGPGEGRSIEGVGTTSIAAYDLYLKALSIQAKSTHSALKDAEALLKEALAIDTDFLNAKTQLAVNFFNQLETGLRPNDATLDEIEALLGQVLAFRPEDVRAKSWYLMAGVRRAFLGGGQVNWAAVTEEFRALTNAAAPSEIDPKIHLAELLGATDQYEEAFNCLIERRARGKVIMNF